MTKKQCFFTRLIKSILPERVEVGQVWRFDLDRDCPFKERHYVLFTVLEVKDGYVKCHSKYLSGEELTTSFSIDWFKVGANRIS